MPQLVNAFYVITKNEIGKCERQPTCLILPSFSLIVRPMTIYISWSCQ